MELQTHYVAIVLDVLLKEVYRYWHEITRRKTTMASNGMCVRGLGLGEKHTEESFKDGIQDGRDVEYKQRKKTQFQMKRFT